MFRASWVIQAAVGWAVVPRIRTRRVACSITARTVKVAPVSVFVSKKSAARMACLGAQEARPGGVVALGCGVDAVFLEDVPHGGGGDLDAAGREFAVDAPVAPVGVVVGEPEHQGADGAQGARAAGGAWGGMPWR